MINRIRVVCIFVASLCVAPQNASSQLIYKKYKPARNSLVNPERGMYRVNVTGMTIGKITPYEPLDRDWLRKTRESYALVFRYFGLKQWRTVPLPDSVLRFISDDFTAIRSAGLKCIPRFAYSANIGEPDAPLEIILRHLDQLQPILRKNKDVIAVMQAGFIGAWGEWHSSTNGNDSLVHKRRVLMKILDVLPKDRMVQVRTPQYKQQIFKLSLAAGSAITSREAFSGVPLARVGHHNDCFLADETDMGTYWRGNKVDTASAKAYLQRENRFVPMGGETCKLSSFAACSNALKEMERLSWSFLNVDYDEEVLTGFTKGGCMEEITRSLGYRLSLIDARFPSRVKSGGMFAFEANIVNLGWASPYNPRDVELVLRNRRSGERFAANLRLDPRWWFAKDSARINVNIAIPMSMPRGFYEVLLNLPDPESSLAGRADYAIQLANEGTWESATGYNNLLDSVRVDGVMSGKPSRSKLEFKRR